MAGRDFTAVTGEVSLGAGTAKTILMAKTASNIRAQIKGVGLYVKGTGPTDTPILVEIYRGTSDGTMSAFTPDPDNDDDSETLQTLFYHTAVSEPTTNTNPMRRFYVHPQTGAQFYFPFERPITQKGGGSRVTMKCTAAQAQTVVGSFDMSE